MLNPVRATIEGIGRLLTYLGWIDGDRAYRIADLAWPRIVTGIARMSKSTADVAMVGIALGPAAIAGVGYGLPFWMLAFILGGGVAGGTISLVSQRVGADEERGVDAAITVSAIVAAGVTIPFAGLFGFIPEPFIQIIGSGEQAITYGADYLRVASLAMPFAALNLVASRAFVGANDAQTPMMIRAGAAVGNIVLNVPLIFVFDLGVVGAALGTLISNAAATAFFAAGLLRGHLPMIGALPLRLHRAAPFWNGETARSLRRIATPLVLRNVALNGGEFPMLAIVSLFGPNAVAAFVVALRVRALMNTPGWGFGLASSSLVGQAMGTGDARSTTGYAQDALRFTVAAYGVTALCVFAFAGPISTLFVQDPEVLEITIALVRATCLSVLAWGLMNGALGPLRAAGDTRWPFYAQVFGLVICALPTAYLGATTELGFYGLYAALILETGVPAAILYMRYRSGRWNDVAFRSQRNISRPG
ncbi:MATE family efflux transporter [Longibacter salinarum]|uniref:Multidrug-efflux transporter n=1 Tax=Longibacter salinarum TaxID=1850348 RepID=A0A2A8CU18_9BACT|nr:MATE family efflux transporter [Longibacter salinarum]